MTVVLTITATVAPQIMMIVIIIIIIKMKWYEWESTIIPAVDPITVHSLLQDDDLYFYNAFKNKCSQSALTDKIEAGKLKTTWRRQAEATI